jgi:hypothetical protein
MATSLHRVPLSRRSGIPLAGLDRLVRDATSGRKSINRKFDHDQTISSR